MEELECYKVVRVTDKGKYISISAMEFVEYIPYEWAHKKSKCGPLASFDSMENVERFVSLFGVNRADMKKGTNFKVFKCKIVNSVFHSLWNSTGTATYYLPKGTILADSIMLLEEVQ